MVVKMCMFMKLYGRRPQPDIGVETAVDSPGPFPKVWQGSSRSGETGPWAMGSLLGPTVVVRLAGYRYSWEPGVRLLKA
jgi:hypothetical protein